MGERKDSLSAELPPDALTAHSAKRSGTGGGQRLGLTLSDLGCMLAILGLALFIPLAIIGRHLLGASTGATLPGLLVGWALLAIFAFFAIFNFYLSTIRPWLHSRRGSSEYKRVSGIPIVHVAFLALAIFTFPPNIWIGILMLVLLALDTGAAHWAALAVIDELLPKRG